MRILALTVAALVFSGAAAGAQTARRHASSSGDAVQVQASRGWTAPIDNRRPAFAAHIGPNGQGVD